MNLMVMKSKFCVGLRLEVCAAAALVLSLLFLQQASGQGTGEDLTEDGESVSTADSYLKSGQPEKAINIYRDLLKRVPGAPWIHLRLARAYEAMGEPKQAIEHSRIAHDLAPLDDDIAFMYGNLLIDTGDPGDAVPVLQKLLERAPEYPGAEDRLLEACAKSKDWKVALPILEKRLEGNPDDIKARERLADCYLGDKEWAKAIEEYLKILSSDPDNGRAVARLALAYRGDGKPGEAYGTLEGYLDEHPEDRDARKALRDLNSWMRRGGNQARPRISTTNPNTWRLRGLTDLFRPASADEQVSYDFYWQRSRNKRTGDRSASYFHDAEFNTVLNEKLQLNLDISFRQDGNNEGVTPIWGSGFQYNWSDALDFQATAAFEPHRGANMQFTFPLELDWWPTDDLELSFYETPTRYWDSNFSNSSSVQGTYHAHRFIKGLRFRFGGYHDLIERPSDYFATIDGHAKPLMLWTGQFDVEKDFELPFGMLFTGGYSFGYNSNNTKFHIGYGGVQRQVGENVSLFGSFSAGIDSDEWEYLGAGAYAGINFKF